MHVYCYAHCAQGTANQVVFDENVRAMLYVNMNGVQEADRCFSSSSLDLFFLIYLTLGTYLRSFQVVHFTPCCHEIQNYENYFWRPCLTCHDSNLTTKIILYTVFTWYIAYYNVVFG